MTKKITFSALLHLYLCLQCAYQPSNIKKDNCLLVACAAAVSLPVSRGVQISVPLWRHFRAHEHNPDPLPKLSSRGHHPLSTHSLLVIQSEAKVTLWHFLHRKRWPLAVCRSSDLSMVVALLLAAVTSASWYIGPSLRGLKNGVDEVWTWTYVCVR